MRTKRMILTLLFSALLLQVEAVERGATGNQSNISRIIQILKIPVSNEYKINNINSTRTTNGAKTFSSVLRKFKSTNRTSSHDSAFKYFQKFRAHRVHYTPHFTFLKRFKRNREYPQTQNRVKFDILHIKPHLAVRFEKNNYIVLQGKPHEMLHGKHFSPKLSVVKLLYAIVDRFWTPPLGRKKPAPSCCFHCCRKSRR